MSKAKYSTYKPSKTFWQEQIPSHWQETELRMLFADNKNKNIGLVERNLLSLSYGKLKRKDIDNATGLVPASFEGYQIIDEGYIVLRFTDLQNDKKSLRVGYANEKGIITNAYIGLAPKADFHSKYFYYQLHFLDKIKYFYNLGGGVRQSLAYKEFGRETVLIPSKDEQTAIANFLDFKLAKIDRFIRKKKQLIKLLNEQKAAIINDAVTGKINCLNQDLQDDKMKQDLKKSKTSSNPQNPDADRKMKPSGIEWLGYIPEHWEVRKLKYVAEIYPSNVDKHSKEGENTVRLCNYTDVYKNDYITNDMNLMVATASDEQIERFTLLENDVIITKDSETANDIAVPAIVKENLENVVCGYHLSVMRPNEKILGEFLFRILQSKTINIQFEVNANGVTRVGLGTYSQKNPKVPIPPIAEQQEIIDFILNETKTITTTISTIEKEIALVEEYKTALIAEAVTGKIDVREYCLNQDVEGLEDEHDFEEENAYTDESDELNIAAEMDGNYGT
jgi:type I restriction enzyme S subunit